MTLTLLLRAKKKKHSLLLKNHRNLQYQIIGILEKKAAPKMAFLGAAIHK
jgi:hypothetical protein